MILSVATFLLLALLPTSIPQMPRFDIPGPNYAGAGHVSRDGEPRGHPTCPRPGEIPWCQCEVVSGSGLVVTCADTGQDDIARLRSSLTKHHVHRLELTDLQPSVTHLSSWMLRNVSLANIAVVRSAVKDMDEDLFSGLEQTLVSVSFQSCKLTYVPRGINKIPSLKSLDLRANNISELYPYSFYGASIAHLDLSHNVLTSLTENAFLGLEGNLRSLAMAGNMFTHFPMSAVRNLQNLEDLNLELLYLDQNRLVTIPSDTFRHNKRLRTINLSHNHLRNIEGLFSQLPALESLDLADNYLLSISDNVFSYSQEIRTLTLSHNNLYQISESAFKPLQKLNELKLSYNFLSHLSEDLLRNNLALHTLALDHNMIESVANKSFKGSPKLQKLQLNDNLISDIRQDHFSSQASLTELHLENNRLTQLEPHAFSSLSSLTFLNLAGNQLPELGDVMMRYPSSLVSLLLHNNQLGKFDENSFSGQTSLELIKLHGNKIATIKQKLFHELINLFRLSLVDNQIKEIEDKAFEHCVQLRFLDLSFNKLESLTKFTLHNLNQLEELSLKHNNIQTIETGAFTALHHLKQLDLSHNSLYTIREGTFYGCRSLNTLRIHNAMITSIQSGSLTSLSSLLSLDIGHNYLTDVSTWRQLESLGKLQVLSVSGNNLKNISHAVTLQKFPHLIQVEIENCQISLLNGSFFRDNRELQIIKLGGNFISRLPEEFFSKQVFLSELSLASNHLTAVPGNAMKYLFNLQKLDLSGNLLTELDDSSFDDVTGLTALDLSRNLISLVTNRVFHNITMLQTLSLAGNHLMDFPTSTFLPLDKLSSLSVADNQLQYIPVALQGLRQVKSMNISGNAIVKLRKGADSGGMMNTVEELVISRTTLTQIDQSDMDLCPNLVKLSLPDNRILVVQQNAFSSLNKLQDLDISRNFIARVPGQSLIGLGSLRTFNLSKNRLNLLDIFPPDLEQLKILDLSFNEIGALEAKSFHYLLNLVKLDLRNNKISTISPEVFLSEQSLKGLDLRSNRLEKLPYSSLDIIQNTLESLHIEGNPFVCSCHSFHQKLWLTQNRKWIDRTRKSYKVGPRCTAPEGLKDRWLLTTKDAELCPLPSVSSFNIGNVTTSSVLISWDSKNSNMTGLKGFLVAYHRLDTNDRVKKFQVGAGVKMFRLTDLKDDSVYLVCVITQGSSYSDYNYRDNYLFSEAIRLDRPHTAAASPPQSSFSDSIQYPLMSLSGGEEETGQGQGDSIPSSNDTRYLITKPIILNLDSASSRCNKIKTPLDPSKLNMVDNKQLSALIGCSSGLMIFFCIIISIVARPKKHKEEDVPLPPSRANSLTESSYKSPSFKSRSDSLVYDKTSYLNSTSSSLTRLNGADHEVRIRKDSCSTSNLIPSHLHKNTTDTRSNPTATLQRNQKTKNIPPSSQKKPSLSQQNTISRQSSSDASGGAVRKTGNRRRNNVGDTLERGRKGPHRRGYEVNSVAEDCIPMIEYNSNHSSPQQTLHVPRARVNNSDGYDFRGSSDSSHPINHR